MKPRKYKKIVNAAQKEVSAPYQEELKEIEDKLAKRGKEALPKEDKKKLQIRQKTILVTIEEETKKLVKQRFDYQLPIAEVQKAGISTTGAPIENELIPLEQEFTAYRTEQTLWKNTYQAIHYALDSEGHIIRMCDTK